MSGISGLITNVHSRFFFTIHFVTSSLIHIRQKEKIAIEIAVKVASATKGPFTLATLTAIFSANFLF
jgi:hypothetical protein